MARRCGAREIPVGCTSFISHKTSTVASSLLIRHLQAEHHNTLTPKTLTLSARTVLVVPSVIVGWGSNSVRRHALCETALVCQKASTTQLIWLLHPPHTCAGLVLDECQRRFRSCVKLTGVLEIWLHRWRANPDLFTSAVMWEDINVFLRWWRNELILLRIFCLTTGGIIMWNLFILV